MFSETAFWQLINTHFQDVKAAWTWFALVQAQPDHRIEGKGELPVLSQSKSLRYNAPSSVGEGPKCASVHAQAAETMSFFLLIPSTLPFFCQVLSGSTQSGVATSDLTGTRFDNAFC